MKHQKDSKRYQKRYIFYSALNFNVVKTNAFCSGNRQGLGSNPNSGRGVESLAKCAEHSLSDSFCDGTGYFDAIKHGNSYQCKCPKNGACSTNTRNLQNWNIYQTTESGIHLLDDTNMVFQQSIILCMEIYSIIVFLHSN